MMSLLILELPYDVSEETNEYTLAPERCILLTSSGIIPLWIYCGLINSFVNYRNPTSSR